VKIILPWPDSKLSPNAKRRTHWRVYTPAIKAARTAGCYAAYEAANGGMREIRQAFNGDDKIDLAVTFYPPDRRRRDDDGMVGAFKHFRDGIADALGVDDHRFRVSYTFAEPRKPGSVEVVL
jgi:crossover junction endodeoxyribonuclease RusA